jgi:hypothetical protein
MTRNTKILSSIDAAANIQVFLLEQRYFPTLSSSSICQNEAVVKDILRLAEYIRSQCQLLRTTDFQIVDDSKVIEGTEASPHSDDIKNVFLPENHMITHEILPVDLNSSGGLSVSSPKLQAGQKSPGFDRLLNKILSPSKPAAPELHEVSATASASPAVPAEQQRDVNYTDRDFSAKALIPKSSPLFSPSTVTIERISSYVDPLYLCQSDSSSQNGSGPGMADPNVSYVRIFSGDNCFDNDDDDVFDLLKSVDDWPALRTFFRGEIPSTSDILENKLGYSREEHDEPVEDNLCRHYLGN